MDALSRERDDRDEREEHDERDERDERPAISGLCCCGMERSLVRYDS